MDGMADQTGAVILSVRKPVRMGYHLRAERQDSEHQHERKQPSSTSQPQDEQPPVMSLPISILALILAKLFVIRSSYFEAANLCNRMYTGGIRMRQFGNHAP
jgi:hypothetical protein